MTTLAPNNDFGPSVFRPFSWPSKHAIRNDKFIARDDTTSIQQLIWKGTAMTAKKIATQNNVEALIAAANEEKITVPTQTTTEPETVETPAAVIEEDVVDAENTEDEDSNGKISVTGKLKGFIKKHKKKVVVTTLVIALVGAVAGALSQDSETEDDEDNNENDSAEGESSED